MDLIDLESNEGFVQAAGKKKKKQATTFNWLDDEGDKKKDGDGADGGGDGNKEQNGGDSGSTGGNGGDDGDKRDDDKNGGEANDDMWDFAPVGGKKKNKNKAADTKEMDGFGLPDIPSTDFHEIRLDDAGGGGGEDSLDLGLGTKAEKITTGITAWTSSWATGSWGWGGLKSPSAQSPKPVEDEQPKSPASGENNPWGVQTGKSKKTTPSTFAFGSFDQVDETRHEPMDFLGSRKSDEKKEISGFSWGVPAAKTADNTCWGDLNSSDDHPNEEEKSADTQGASDDIWGFSTKKDVGLYGCPATAEVAV